MDYSESFWEFLKKLHSIYIATRPTLEIGILIDESRALSNRKPTLIIIEHCESILSKTQLAGFVFENGKFSETLAEDVKKNLDMIAILKGELRDG